MANPNELEDEDPDAFLFVVIGFVVLYFVPPFVLIVIILCKLRGWSSIVVEGGSDDAGDAGEAEAVPRVLVSFKNVRYCVPVGVKGEDEKFILNGVDGYFRPFSLTAIMGPSGCGKSTLMDVLAGQKTTGKITGTIRVNGLPVTQLYRRCSAYVLQNDVLYKNLSVKETLWFISELRLPGRTRTQKLRTVDSLLRDLDLHGVQHSRIGDDSGGLSGGQKRRVTVAIELITSPGLVFLDEPTSGLDAYGSLKVVSVLRRLADKGRTVVCTIHQPRSDIFKLFDTVLLMKAGRNMYFGPNDGILAYFARAGIDIAEGANPADFVVDLTHDDANADPAETGENDPLVARYRTSDEKRACDVALAKMHSGRPDVEGVPPPLEDAYPEEERDSKYAASLRVQVFVLVQRAFYNDTRNFAWIMGWVLGGIMMVFFGLLYNEISQPELGNQAAVTALNNELLRTGVCSAGLSELRDPFDVGSDAAVEAKLMACGENLQQDLQLSMVRNAFLYQLMAAMYFGEAAMVASVHLDKAIFTREHNSRSYSTFAWHSAWLLRIFFAGLVKAIVFPPLVYFSGHLAMDIEAYVLFCIFIGSMCLSGASAAVLCASAIPSYEVAALTFVVINLVSQNLSGFFLSLDLIPPWFYWLSYLNFFRWTYNGVLEAQQASDEDFGSKDFSQPWEYAIFSLIFPVAFQLGGFLASWSYYRSNAVVAIDDEADPEAAAEMRRSSRALSSTSSRMLRAASTASDAVAEWHRDKAMTSRTYTGV